MITSGRGFLIWSIEHGAWWAPERRGYTYDVDDAGRYSHADARAIVADANVAAVNECLIPIECVEPAPDAVVEHGARVRAELRQEIDGAVRRSLKRAKP